MFVKSKICDVFICLTFVLSVFASSVCAHEFQYADKTQKTPLRWRNKTINLALSDSLRQLISGTKSTSDIAQTIERSLMTWERATGIKFSLVWTDKKTVGTEGNADQVNLITIADTPENIAFFQNEAKDATARTQIFFDKNNFIIEADIVINPHQSFSTDGSFGTYDLEAMLTHELGHLLGLNHSTVMAATMYAQQGKNGTFDLPSVAPRTLAEDDLSAIHSLYGNSNEKELCCGQISGSVQEKDGKPLSNWQVWAEEAVTGRLMAVVLSRKNGSFQISGLKKGNYQVFAQPLTENFYAESVAEVTIEATKTVNVQRQFALRSRNTKPAILGYNGQLSLLPIEFARAERTHLIFFGGENFYFADFAVGKINIRSPFFAVNQASLSIQNVEAPISVLSFEMQISDSVLPGEYNVQFQKFNGDYFVSLGCFSVENQ